MNPIVCPTCGNAGSTAHFLDQHKCVTPIHTQRHPAYITASFARRDLPLHASPETLYHLVERLGLADDLTRLGARWGSTEVGVFTVTLFRHTPKHRNPDLMDWSNADCRCFNTLVYCPQHEPVDYTDVARHRSDVTR